MAKARTKSTTRTKARRSTPKKRAKNIPMVVEMAATSGPAANKAGKVGDFILKTADKLGKKLTDIVKANPKKKARKRVKGKRNPVDTAEKAYRDFHGLEPKEVIEVISQEHHHKYTWEVGQLVCLEIIQIDGKPNRLISAGFSEEKDGKELYWAFDSDNYDKSDVPMLTCSEKGTQLFIIGGQQALTFKGMQGLGLREDDLHDHMLIGTIAGVTYRTKKIFEEDGKAKVDFEHPFGKKESKGGHGDQYPDPKGVMPVLVYYPRSEKLAIIGGRYYVAPPEGWLNGVSPGIVN